jgi:hypothetical protein
MSKELPFVRPVAPVSYDDAHGCRIDANNYIGTDFLDEAATSHLTCVIDAGRSLVCLVPEHMAEALVNLLNLDHIPR